MLARQVGTLGGRHAFLPRSRIDSKNLFKSVLRRQKHLTGGEGVCSATTALSERSKQLLDIRREAYREAAAATAAAAAVRSPEGGGDAALSVAATKPKRRRLTEEGAEKAAERAVAEKQRSSARFQQRASAAVAAIGLPAEDRRPAVRLLSPSCAGTVGASRDGGRRASEQEQQIRQVQETLQRDRRTWRQQQRQAHETARVALLRFLWSLLETDIFSLASSPQEMSLAEASAAAAARDSSKRLQPQVAALAAVSKAHPLPLRFDALQRLQHLRQNRLRGQRCVLNRLRNAGSQWTAATFSVGTAAMAASATAAAGGRYADVYAAARAAAMGASSAATDTPVLRPGDLLLLIPETPFFNNGEVVPTPASPISTAASAAQQKETEEASSWCGRVINKRTIRPRNGYTIGVVEAWSTPEQRQEGLTVRLLLGASVSIAVEPQRLLKCTADAAAPVPGAADLLLQLRLQQHHMQRVATNYRLNKSQAAAVAGLIGAVDEIAERILRDGLLDASTGDIVQPACLRIGTSNYPSCGLFRIINLLGGDASPSNSSLAASSVVSERSQQPAHQSPQTKTEVMRLQLQNRLAEKRRLGDVLHRKRRGLQLRLGVLPRLVRRHLVASADIIFSTLSGCGSEILDPLCEDESDVDFAAAGAPEGGTNIIDQRRGKKLISSPSSSSLSSDLHFACVIVDEAGQATEVASLIPLRLRCDRLFLFGDPLQLPPLICSFAAQAKGLGRSLMARLALCCQQQEQKAWEEDEQAQTTQLQREVAFYFLATQYRMHPLIVEFPEQAASRLTTPEDRHHRNSSPLCLLSLPSAQFPLL
ncbi:tRNA-splicing endonuclease positive [Cyclospora cayetanensis]|uniref:tRNA-splicing endonuclease positive n=1 Tax=Cyclospora cayetanensis TaxID=88456 RepID=A0A1D3DB91_9EIME|nr:tRNA-splicing endonuclease positive [Cyclospora cayetanensis]